MTYIPLSKPTALLRYIAGAAIILFGWHLEATPLYLTSYPDVSQNTLVFVYRDAIWVASLSGGNARLVSDLGERPKHPKFSPDGQSIAYSAELNGNVDVFVVPVKGGPVKQITHHPAVDEMVDWYPDGQAILFKSTMLSVRPNFNRLFQVDAQGGHPKPLPVSYGETAAISGDQKEVIFTFHKDFQEEVWKRYLGGRAPDLWALSLVTGKTAQITRHPAPDSVPMLTDDKVYFLSERGANKRNNIWRMGRQDHTLEQVTHFVDTDVRNPSIGDSGIVFETAGGLHFLDLKKNQQTTIPLNLSIARLEQVPSHQSVGHLVMSVDAGSNEQILIEARGDVFTIDVALSVFKNLTNTSGIAERYPALSPDGRRVAYFSDRSGEYQLTILDLTTGIEKTLTHFQAGFRYQPRWSPDGKWLAFMDQQQVLWLANSQTGKLTNIDQGQWRYHWDMDNFRAQWSRDGRWLTWSRGSENRNQAIYLYDLSKKTKQQLTSGFYSDFEPVFDPSGNYLATIGFRNFAPQFGDIDATFTYKDSMVVSLIALTANTVLPQTPGAESPQPRKKVAIDFARTEQRMVILPFPPGKYSHLAFHGDAITAFRHGDKESNTELLAYSIRTGEVKTIWQDKLDRVYDIGSKRAAVKTTDNKLILIDTTGEQKAQEIDLETTATLVDRSAEYLQMFDDSWRYQRDFFYDPGLHGVNWKAIGHRYRQLAGKAHSDQELTSILREMHGELAAGHVYASAEPPYRRGDAANVGLLGADFVVQDGRYKIERILQPGVRVFQHRSPLDVVGIDIKEGEFLLAVNGVQITPDKDIWYYFSGLKNQVVELTIGGEASGRNSRIVKVTTIDSEQKLRELCWVEANRKYVDQASNSTIGYIYVPDTGVAGQNELMQMYRAQYHKEGLIIDERFNTGGALGDRLVELLNRPPLSYFSSRNANHYPLPELAHPGPKVMITNGWSYSGGDGLPLLFKAAGAGTLIGTRTWGGLIGPGMRMSLVNGGSISAPPQRVYDVQGRWAEGNEGVKPNIEITNDPGKLAEGIDQQLNLAVKTLLDQIQLMPPLVVPAYSEGWTE